MIPEHANTFTRTKTVGKRDMNVCSALLNQRCALIRALARFIRALVCSKKKHHLVLKINNFFQEIYFVFWNRYILVIVFSEKGNVTT